MFIILFVILSTALSDKYAYIPVLQIKFKTEKKCAKSSESTRTVTITHLVKGGAKIQSQMLWLQPGFITTVPHMRTCWVPGFLLNR